MKTQHNPSRTELFFLLSLLLSLACNLPALAPPSGAPADSVGSTPRPPSSERSPAGDASAVGLSTDDIATLSSLRMVDDHPLYIMRYQGAYTSVGSTGAIAEPGAKKEPLTLRPAWACSLFAALADTENMLYGRNFDWRFSPALLLFTDPPDGYASASMVDLSFLGFSVRQARSLNELPLAERKALLNAPGWPIDGMNEHGLVVGMAAVPPGNVPPDPEKPTVGSLAVIRVMLDHARDIDEAIALLNSYNVDMRGGPPIHYLIADPSGSAALVEFYEGEMIVLFNDVPWHQATNFLRASAGQSAAGRCWRYDTIGQRLSEENGLLTPSTAMELLASVAQKNTRWSIVYSMHDGDIHLAMGREYEQVRILHLDPFSR